MNKTFAVCTLGCKVNSYESDCLISLFEKEGLTKVPFTEKADIYLINTCSVTNTGDKKSRQAIHKARRNNPDSFIAVLGCYAQAKSEEVKLAGADLVAGTSRREEIVSLALKGVKENLVGDISKERQFEKLPPAPSRERCRAYIKIQDGCDNFCSYCIIPYTRGRVRSRDEASIIEEAILLKKSGYREIVLTGIEVYSYGKDLKNTNLLTLLKKLSEKTSFERIRLSSIDPRAFKGDFAKELSEIKGFCHHLHISAQSGCTETLKRMNRPNTAEEFADMVKDIKHFMPDCAITTDIITGFPGETEDEFLKTRKFVNSLGFSRLHVFPYSERKGTKASLMEQVDVSLRVQRAKILIEDGKKLMKNFADSLVGNTLKVLFEQGKNGIYEGYSENYVRVKVKSNIDISGEIFLVRADKSDNFGTLYATLIDKI